jgi:ankyrin repeat protein
VLENFVGMIIVKCFSTNNYILCLGNTPIHLAAHQGCEGLVTLLVENGADVIVQNKAGTLFSHTQFNDFYLTAFFIIAKVTHHCILQSR